MDVLAIPALYSSTKQTNNINKQNKQLRQTNENSLNSKTANKSNNYYSEILSKTNKNNSYLNIR